MSNSKKIRSKRRFRVSRNRKQRTNGKVVHIDFETRCPMELGTRLHQEIERVMAAPGVYVIGDTHFGVIDAADPRSAREQLMAYATVVPGETVVLYGGDLLHGDGPRDLVKHGDDLYAYDYKPLLDKFMSAVLRAEKKPE